MVLIKIIKNFFINLIYSLFLIIIVNIINYIGNTDWWQLSTEKSQRLKIETDATNKAQSLVSEGVEIQRKLSFLIIRRDTTNKEYESENFNK